MLGGPQNSCGGAQLFLLGGLSPGCGWLRFRVGGAPPNLSETPYLERLQILKLDRLELRRIRFDIVMCFCIVKGLNGLKFDDFFSYAPARTARSQSRNSYLLYKKSVNKTCRQSFFAERVVDYWNCLGDDVINSKSAENFKLKLKKVNLDRFCKVSDF